MTINVALVTNTALILGCDSIASTGQHFISPDAILRDANGWLADADGYYSARFKLDDMQHVVTNAWGGVQKLSLVYSAQGPNTQFTTVSAVTAGLATLKDRTMHSLATEFCETNNALKNVDEVVTQFLEFIHKKYQEHYATTETPPEIRDDIEFLIGGYGCLDQFPSLYRLKIKNKEKDLIYGPAIGDHSGLAWAGQAEGIPRILRGWDPALMTAFSKIVDQLYQNMSDTTARILNDTLTALKTQAPAGVNVALPDKPDLENLMNGYNLDIDFANIPLQYGVDLVAWLVSLESGKQKFVRGVPTVGGRTHIGVITKSDGFNELNKPTLKHRNTGYMRD